jgi:hypothetical protein
VSWSLRCPTVLVLVDVVGTHTPFCSTELVPHMLDELVDVVGTHTPFCRTELVPQTLVGGGWLVLGTLFSMIIQRFDCLNICLPLPKTAWPLFSQECEGCEVGGSCEGMSCPNVGEILNVNSTPNINSEAIISAGRLTDRVCKLYYISNASPR